MPDLEDVESDSGGRPVRAPRDRARSAWREQALTDAAQLETLLLWVEHRSPEPPEIVVPIADRIREHLRIAAYTAANRGPWVRRIIFLPKPGADLERVGGNLDTARADILGIAPESYVRGQIRVLLTKVRRFPLGDARRTVVEELSRKPPLEPLSEADRSALIAATRAADAAARRDLDRVRSFRNQLVTLTTVLMVLSAALIAVGAMWPGVIPLCFVPETEVVCPTRSAPIAFESPAVDEAVRATASRADLAVVALVGVVGAALAATTAARRFRGSSVPDNPIVVASLLKLPAGALTAVLGLFLIRGQFIPGFAALDSTAQILAWAVVFGYAQQLFTRLMDERAQRLLDAVEAPAEQETAALDTQTAEAFTSAVSTTLRNSAPRAIREAIAGPSLINYDGWVTLQLLDASGAELPTQRSLSLVAGEPYTMNVVIGQHERSGLPMALRISDGVDADPVHFTVDIDSDDTQLRHRKTPATVGAREGETALHFPILATEQRSSRYLWVRVSQQQKIVLQIELEVLIADGQPRHATSAD